MDINISAKEFEKLSKYKDLQNKVERMWQLKTSVIPIVVGALGLAKWKLQNILKTFLVNKAEIQKIALTSTAHILKKRYQYKLQQKTLAQNKKPKTKKN